MPQRMRQSGSALRKLIRSVAVDGIWSGEANGQERVLCTKPKLAAAGQRSWNRLPMGPGGGCHHDLIGSNRSRFLVSLVGCKIRTSSLSITKQQVVD